MKIIDLHTHILPGVDDGADSMETALEMLRSAQASNVIALAATPHCNLTGMPGPNYFDAELLEHLRKLRWAAEEAGIEVKIMTGMEVRAEENLRQLLLQGKLLGINGSRYLLTEFAPDTTLTFCRESLQTVLDAGMIPLVAHPERYGAIWQNPDAVNEWLDMGCHVQLTSGSVLGKFGRDAWRTADYLIRNDMVALVASDAHSLHFRTNNLIPVYEHISTHYSSDYAKMLLLNNPYAVCQNETL